MSIVKEKDIAGFFLDLEMVCTDCLDGQDNEPMKLDKIVHRKNLDDGEWYFCDRCYKRMQ